MPFAANAGLEIVPNQLASGLLAENESEASAEFRQRAMLSLLVLATTYEFCPAGTQSNSPRFQRSCCFNVEQLSQLFLCTEVAKRAKQLRQLFYNDSRRKSPQSKYLKAARPLKSGATRRRPSGTNAPTKMPSRFLLRSSREQLRDRSAFAVFGSIKRAAFNVERGLRADPHRGKHGGVQIVDVDRVFNRQTGALGGRLAV